MGRGVVWMIMLLWFASLATTIASDTVTAATVSYSSDHSSHIHRGHGLFHHHPDDRIMGGSTSLQPHRHHFVLKEEEGNMEQAELTSSAMDGHDRRDVEALLSFRKALTSDPDGSLLN
jgi:hypothetical protein